MRELTKNFAAFLIIIFIDVIIVLLIYYTDHLLGIETYGFFIGAITVLGWFDKIKSYLYDK